MVLVEAIEYSTLDDFLKIKGPRPEHAEQTYHGLLCNSVLEAPTMWEVFELVPMKTIRLMQDNTSNWKPPKAISVYGELIGLGYLEWLRKKIPALHIFNGEPGLRQMKNGYEMTYGPAGTSIIMYDGKFPSIEIDLLASLYGVPIAVEVKLGKSQVQQGKKTKRRKLIEGLSGHQPLFLDLIFNDSSYLQMKRGDYRIAYPWRDGIETLYRSRHLLKDFISSVESLR